jgi:class 3 adenylate cyclase
VDDSSRDALTAAGLPCSSCGTELPPNSKFCNECGAPVAKTTRSAEYKQVTVLFADVVRSMDIAAKVGVERLREIMAALVDRAAAVVRRYGGTLDKFTGDGIMAIFGAPVALEDHAARACRAALEIHSGISDLAAEVSRLDGQELRLRIGLNSGQVITGEIGTGAAGYTAIGEQVGMAQRMESVAPPGGVMVSASTARLVEAAAALGAAELVQIKGADEPVAAHRLLGMAQEHPGVRHAESNLVGRRWEMAAVEGLLERAIDGHGAVVTVVGSPGIGKSRLVREVAAMAATRGVAVFTAFCESHASDVPFHVVARLLRAATGVGGLDGPAARALVRARNPEADPEDLLLFDDLLGIADPEVVRPTIDPDARRRRLTALVNGALLARQSPAVYVLEDAHWIDDVSESMLTKFFTVIPQTPSLVLITYRPEYEGALARVHGAQTIALAPLSDPETTALVSELLGPGPSVGVSTMVAEKAAGNPFFAEEIVRDLAERGVLRGNRTAYESTADVAELSVPATLQATIAARIDRLDSATKRTLCAAAVIGSQFSEVLLETLGIDPVLEGLVRGEFIDQIRFTRQPEFVFHHPLIRTVAYESQLKSDRAELHRRVAAGIESRAPAAADENASLIAEHLQAAGDLRAAYGWHMRAATWATNRDIRAARISWERARDIADRLAESTPDQLALRIAPRTMLCGNGWRVHANVAATHFGELKNLCDEAGDKSSLAVGMAGLMLEQMFIDGRLTDATRLAAELMTLVESIGDEALTVDLTFAAMHTAAEAGLWPEALRWGDNAVSSVSDDHGSAGLLIGSPLALTFGLRGLARAVLMVPGWRNDLDGALEVASRSDPLSHALAVAYRYTAAIPMGLLRADEKALHDTEDALRVVQNSADDFAVGYGRLSLGVVLLQSDSPTDRARGAELLRQAREMSINREFSAAELPMINAHLAYEQARDGDHERALNVLRDIVDGLTKAGLLLGWGVACTNLLVGCLLDRGTESDIREAEAATERLAAAGADGHYGFLDCVVLRARALLARARGDESAYREYRHRYRELATAMNYDGHRARAEAMP